MAGYEPYAPTANDAGQESTTPNSEDAYDDSAASATGATTGGGDTSPSSTNNGNTSSLTSQTLNADGTPKRPMNAFMIFARRRRPQVSAENQAMRTGEISKILSREWTEMSQSEKQFYLDQAKQLKDTFNTKYPDYVYRRRPNNSRKRRRADSVSDETAQQMQQRAGDPALGGLGGLPAGDLDRDDAHGGLGGNPYPGRAYPSPYGTSAGAAPHHHHHQVGQQQQQQYRPSPQGQLDRLAYSRSTDHTSPGHSSYPYPTYGESATRTSWEGAGSGGGGTSSHTPVGAGRGSTWDPPSNSSTGGASELSWPPPTKYGNIGSGSSWTSSAPYSSASPTTAHPSSPSNASAAGTPGAGGTSAYTLHSSSSSSSYYPSSSQQSSHHHSASPPAPNTTSSSNSPYHSYSQPQHSPSLSYPQSSTSPSQYTYSSPASAGASADHHRSQHSQHSHGPAGGQHLSHRGSSSLLRELPRSLPYPLTPGAPPTPTSIGGVGSASYWRDEKLDSTR